MHQSANYHVALWHQSFVCRCLLMYYNDLQTCRSCMLQAESEKLRQAWIQAVQASIASAYKDITDNYYIEVQTCAQIGI